MCSNCSLDTKETDKPPCTSGDCFVSSFSENYLSNFEDENVYFIKGIAMDKIDYGLKIKLIEDLKGNFPKNVDTFIAWGDGVTCTELNRLDKLSLYDNQDTLLMLLWPAGKIKPCQNFPEKKGDYTTINCGYSVLRLTNDGNVTGHISPWKEGIGMKEETMPWEELKELLKEQSL